MRHALRANRRRVARDDAARVDVNSVVDAGRITCAPRDRRVCVCVNRLPLAVGAR